MSDEALRWGCPSIRDVSQSQELWFLRHGQTGWNRDGRLQGRNSIPLSDEGGREVGRAVSLLKSLATPSQLDDCTLWTSPVRRTRESATIVGEALSRQPRDHDGLAEFDLGDWIGRKRTSLRNEEGWKRYIAAPLSAAFPGGETMANVWQRTHRAFLDIAQSGARTSLVVTHGGPIRLLVAAVLEAPPTAIHRIHVTTGSWTIFRVSNDGDVRLQGLSVRA